MNYFELFEIPVALKVDKALLARKYFELQKKFHPDFFSTGTEAEQAERKTHRWPEPDGAVQMRSPVATLVGESSWSHRQRGQTTGEAEW